MTQDELLDKILNSAELPTLPTVASKLISMTAKEDATLADIGDLVSRDISLSAKILKVSNSAFYSFPQQIGSIQQAVSILGMNAVRSLVLSFSFLTIKGGRSANRFNFETFWEKSLASAVAARLILEKVKGIDAEEGFITGLLQNLGELIYARTFPEEYEKVLEIISDNQEDTRAAERVIFGVDHTLVGTTVAKSWGFPESLVAPLEFHHNPEKYTGGNANLRTTIRAVYLSDHLTNILFSDKPEAYHKKFQKESSKLLGLAPEAIESILDQLHIRVKEAGTYFNLKVKSNKSVQEILQEANIRLSLINLDYDQMNKQLIQAKINLENLTKALEEKNKILDNLANIDGLTGINNHRFFQNALEQEISRSLRNGSSISLLFIDIDFFKKFNDTYGHQVGDFVLAQFARTIKENIRQYDVLARYGGEEFVVVLPETNTADALAVAEKLRVAIESTIFSDTREEYHVTASFGHACSKPAVEDNFSKNNFISQADQALYEAKEKGRNRVVSFTPKKKWFSF
ncbi:MAG: GGDEF domain-containing protein [Pseudomonadota bacterium]